MVGYILCLGNGGSSGAGYLPGGRSPCNSEGHSTSSFGQVLTISCSLYRPRDVYSSSSQSFAFQLLTRLYGDYGICQGSGGNRFENHKCGVGIWLPEDGRHSRPFLARHASTLRLWGKSNRSDLLIWLIPLLVLQGGFDHFAKVFLLLPFFMVRHFIEG